MAENYPWSKQDDHFRKALKYLKGRRDGVITSILTPWIKVNQATTNGLELHSMTVIGGRPGTGKTTIKDQIIREAFRLNPDNNLRVLEFSLEMLGQTSAIRGMSAFTGKSYKELCSAEDGGKYKLTDEDLLLCEKYAEEMKQYPIDIVEQGLTVMEFERIIERYMATHSHMMSINNVQKRIYTDTIITLDHSLLLEVDKQTEKSKNDMLYNLGTTLTRLKRKYPIAFIILSQLNRAVDHPDRNEDGKYGNYILESDIFGADALLQHADTVIGLNIPGKQKIRHYGPDRYLIDDMQTMVMHFLKCRNGETGLAFFKTKFKQMMIEEMETPPTFAQQKQGYITTK